MYGNGRDATKVGDLMSESGYTKVASGLKLTDDLYVRNDFRSPIFGPDEIPKLILKGRSYCDAEKLGSSLCHFLKYER